MKARSPWQGMMTIARFNWPFYVAAALVLLASICGLLLLSTFALKIICGFALAGTVYFVLGSLGVSHFVYDRSDLYRWVWLDHALRDLNIRQAIFCHSGFDETSTELREKFSNVQWQILDHFDENQMTEASVRRARALFPPTPETLPARYDAWPVAAGSCDLVLGLLAIHELRSETERIQWFKEGKRCLLPGGRIVLVEHVRDAANFLAFGPGCMHFHSPASWRRCWKAAGLGLADEFHITPFVRVFVLSIP
jgi:SAM-dependent methyltransferase